ncbi:MAG: hypothetical protein ACQEP1_05480 [Nanobdellota archaeon]
MGLTNKREEQLKKMPLVETKVSKSQDGKFLIHRTVITDLKPISYYDAVLKGTASEEQEEGKEKAEA